MDLLSINLLVIIIIIIIINNIFFYIAGIVFSKVRQYTKFED